jgi:hypothetical protein
LSTVARPEQQLPVHREEREKAVPGQVLFNPNLARNNFGASRVAGASARRWKKRQWGGLQQNKALQLRRGDFYTVKKEGSKIKGKHQNLKEKEKKKASTSNVSFP